MAKAKSMSVKIRSSSKHISTGNAQIGFAQAMNAVQTGISRCISRGLASNVKTAVSREYYIVATLFQRFCSRTPIDENYNRYPYKPHEADDEQCRMHWYLNCVGDDKTVRITAQYLYDLKEDVFDVFNDKDSINFIIDILNFELGFQQKVKFTFGNDSPYFRILEYGQYKNNSKNIYKGKKEEHGVVNKHSVQAPIGMMRITWGEIQAVIRSTAKTDAATRLKKQIASKELSPRKAKQIYKLLSSMGGIQLKDMKDYIF